MKLYLGNDFEYPHDAGEPTVPMEAIPRDVQLPAPRNSGRMQRLGHVMQITYHIVAILVLLGGTLAGFAMHFGWIDSWFGASGQHGPAAQSLFTPTPVASPRAPAPLAQDSFARPDQALWGASSGGGAWSGDANSEPAFAITTGAGSISGGQGFFNALLGPLREDESVLLTASISSFAATRANFGALLRFRDANDYDKAYLDGTQLVVLSRSAGRSAILGAAPFAARAGTSYTLRFLAQGSRLLARAWPTGSAEPPTWLVQASGAGISPGFGGLRVLLLPGIQVSVSAFQEDLP